MSNTVKANKTSGEIHEILKTQGADIKSIVY